MKLIAAISAIVALVGSLISGFTPVQADATNLIINPTVASASASNKALPANWSKDKWGNNTTTLTYKTNDGHDDKTSVYVKTTSHKNGDAKWAFDDVAVKPNTKYTFSAWSKSNVQTKMTAQYVSTTGALSYADLATVSASATKWQQKSVTFTTPANVKAMTVFHLINKVGWLQTDDFSLTDNAPVVKAPTVSIAAPAANATVSKTATLSATVDGGSGTVSGVQFKIDGANVGPEITNAPYTTTWDSTKVTDGNHAVTATVRNSLNASATSTGITFKVANAVAATPPTIAITSPANDTTVNKTTVITANATDVKGVAGVTFKLNNVTMGAEDTTAPYSINWDTTQIGDGQYTISAVVRNTANVTASSTVTVNVVNPVTAPETNPGLVSNSSVETADPTTTAKPDQWQNNAWGTNTSKFTYPVAGNMSSRAVRTEITAYTDGDAKWFFNPVTVKANTQYTFTNSYRSSVTTNVVVEMKDTAGALSYVDLGTLPAAATWTPAEFAITTKANTASMTVYHLVNSVGWLEIDDANVALFTAPTTSNPIVNASLETASGTQPANWTSSKWGTNTTNFQYVNEGHTGTKSAKLTVSNYTDGDAKWFFNPITSLEHGKQYRWSTWYKTNAHVQAVAMFTRADGTEAFFGMPQPFPAANSATNWTYYSDTFIVPSDAASVTVFLFIAGNGWLQVDDQNLTGYQPTGWNQPLVSLTFDDGYEANVTNALPVLNQYGFKTTQCYETVDLKNDPATAKKSLNAFISTGHEICSHTVSHPFLSQLTTAQVDQELANSKAYLEQLTGMPIVDFASPYGDYSESVNTEIKKYYQSHRTTDEGYNSKDNLDPYRLRVQNMTPATTLAEFQGWLNQAKADNTWLILVYHDVVNTDPSPYGSFTNDFKQQMAALKASGLTVKTYKDALADVQAQR